MSTFDRKPKPLESDLQSKIIEQALRRRWYGGKMVCQSFRGMMDLYFVRAGRHIWIEAKREGEEARRQQEKRAKEMREHGAEVFVVDTLDEAKVILL